MSRHSQSAQSTVAPLPSTGERLRVLLLTQDLEVWGAQRQLVELAKGLDHARYDVRVATLESGGPLAAELHEHRIAVEAFPRRWRWDLGPISRLTEYMRGNDIDIVHSFMFLPNFYARLAGRLARTPAVISSLRSTGVRIEGWPRLAIDIATCFLCDALIVNSAAGGTQYARYGGLRSRIVVVRNGVLPKVAASQAAVQAAAEAWGLTRFDQLVGMVGALERRKDQGLLIKAMQTVLRANPRTGLVLAGDGAQRTRLESLVRALDLGAHVIFLGTIRPELLYPVLDVYVQASGFGEGTSNSILEAMANGLPVVATDVGGNREVVVDGETGVIVSAGDCARLGTVLAQLLSSPDRRGEMGKAGRERVCSAFSVDAMVSATERVYEQVLARSVASDRCSAAETSAAQHPVQ